MINNKKVFITIIFAILTIFPLTTSALAGCRNLEVPIPGLNSICLPVLPDYIAAIFNFALMIVGIVVLGALLYGGFRWLTSAGNPAALSDAKDQIFSALLGLIILFSAWLILNTINPELIILSQPGTTSCDADTPCPAGQTCVGAVGTIVQGTCVTYPPLPCTVNTDCPPGLKCLPGCGGFCCECTGASDCSSSLICVNGFCKIKIDTTENWTDTTENWGASCLSITDPDVCKANANCTLCCLNNQKGTELCVLNTGSCGTYTCVKDQCGATCGGDGDCAPKTCNQSNCTCNP